MPKLILMQGLPASGKSTRAAEIAKADGNAVRLNKDLLREMLHFNVFTGRNEGLTQEAEEELAVYFLSQGKNVIIDDTNLNPRVIEHWKELAQAHEFKFQIIDMPTEVDECLARDWNRGQKGERSVGEYVIKNMARQYKMYYNDKPDIIVDLDGTLAKIDHRLHYVKGEKKDWKGFFSKIEDDTIREDVVKILKPFHKTHNIVIVSARPDLHQEATMRWLNHNLCIPYFSFDTLIMRRGGDSREDSIVKKEIFDKYFLKDNVSMVIDDRPRVIRMWREQGLNVIDVGSGVEF